MESCQCTCSKSTSVIKIVAKVGSGFCNTSRRQSTKPGQTQKGDENNKRKCTSWRQSIRINSPFSRANCLHGGSASWGHYIGRRSQYERRPFGRVLCVLPGPPRKTTFCNGVVSQRPLLTWLLTVKLAQHSSKPNQLKPTRNNTTYLSNGEPRT